MHGSSSVPQELQDIINKYGGKMKQTYGVPVEEIQRGIKNGVRKINVDTDNRMAITGAIRKVLDRRPSGIRSARLPEAGPRRDEGSLRRPHDRLRPSRQRSKTASLDWPPRHSRREVARRERSRERWKPLPRQCFFTSVQSRRWRLLGMPIRLRYLVTVRRATVMPAFFSSSTSFSSL